MSIGRTVVALDTQSPAVSHDVSHPSGGGPLDQALDAGAVRAWVGARDVVLRGLVHALSNRVGTVTAVGGMLDGASADAERVGLAGRILAGEGERLEGVLAQFRLVTADPFGADAAPEPIALPEVLAAVAALVGVASGAEPTVTVTEDTPPVVVSRAGLIQALLVLLLPRQRDERPLLPRLRAAADGRHAVVWVAGGAVDGPVLAAAGWLLGRAVAVDGDDLRVQLPGLGGG